MRISDWSSDVCSADLWAAVVGGGGAFVIDTPANRCRSRAPLPRAAAVHLFRGAVSAGSGQTPSADEATAAVVVASASTGPTAAGSTGPTGRSEEHTSELQSLMRISYAVFCLKKNKTNQLRSY